MFGSLSLTLPDLPKISQMLRVSMGLRIRERERERESERASERERERERERKRERERERERGIGREGGREGGDEREHAGSDGVEAMAGAGRRLRAWQPLELRRALPPVFMTSLTTSHNRRMQPNWSPGGQLQNTTNSDCRLPPTSYCGEPEACHPGPSSARKPWQSLLGRRSCS